MPRRERIVALVLMVALLAGLAGCSPSTNAPATTSVKTTLNFGLTGDPMNMIPSKTTDQMAKAVFYQIYDTSLRRAADGKILPGLAETWEVSKDGMTITLHIRKGVKFHDGKDLTAEDVAFSLRMLTESPTTGSTMVGMGKDSFVVTDPYTVKINMKAAFGAVLDVLATDARIISKSAFETLGEEGFAKNPVGSGPYKFVERKAGEKIVLKAHEAYWRGTPKIKDVTMKVMTDSNTAIVALEKGELDFLSHAPLVAKKSIAGNQNLRWYETEIAGNIYIQFNMESEHFKNQKVREAISYAVDKAAMVQGAVEGLGTPVATMAPPADFGYIADFQSRPHDIQKAKALLTEAGYPNGFSIKMVTQENATYRKPAEILQGQLREIGINAELEVLERTVFFQYQRESNFELMVSHWTTPVPDAYFIMYVMGHSASTRNFSRMKVAKLDDALETIETSLDPAERLAAYRTAHQIVNDQTLWVPLYTFMAPCAAHKDLQGVKPDSVYRYEVFDYSWAK